MPTTNDTWTIENQRKLFNEMLSRILKDPQGEFAQQCQKSPTACREEAVKIATPMGITIPERNVIFFMPEKRVDYVHLFSVKGKDESVKPENDDLANHFICCYDVYETLQ
jgi:hypothetical protein